MTGPEKALLDGLLDGFDRLYDRECSAADTHALLRATAMALPSSTVIPMIAEAEAKLAQIVRAGAPEEQQNTDALVAVDSLRRHLAEVLY
jgi:hypothetical protein